MQLRSPIGLGTFGLRDGKDFIVASATCSLDDLRAVRDAIDAQLLDAGVRSKEFVAGYHWAERLNAVADELCDVECTMAHVDEIREIASGLLARDAK